MAVRFTPSTDIPTPQVDLGTIPINKVRFTPGAPAQQNLYDTLIKKSGALFGIPENIPAMNPEQMAAGGMPGLAAITQTIRDVNTIPYAFLNQFALDYPRQIMKKDLGMDIPMSANPVANTLSHVAGVVGMLSNPVLNTFGGAKAFLAQPLMRKALISGVQSLAYPTSDPLRDLLNPVKLAGEKAGQFAAGYAGGVALPLATKATGTTLNAIRKSPGAPEWLARNVSGITDFTRGVISRLGKKVFDPQYASDDYVGRVFTPQFREHLFNQLENLGVGWKNTAQLAKFRQKEIDSIAGMGKETRTNFVELMRKGMSAPEAAGLIVKDAGQVMDNTITSYNKPVVINNFINSIKRNLLQENWAVLDSKGNLVPNQVSPVPHDARDNLINLYNYYKNPPVSSAIQVGVGSTPGRSVKMVINAKDWQVMKNSLERLYTGNVQDDRVINNTLKTLIQDAKGSGRGIPGYKNAARMWTDAKTLEDIAPRIDNWTDPVKINTMFAGINAENAGNKYQLMKDIRNSIPGKLYDDLVSHYSQRNFDPEFNPGWAGFRKLGVTEASKWYYGKYPTGVNPIQQGFSSVGKFMGNVGQAMAPVVQPVASIGNKILDKLSQEPNLKDIAAAASKIRPGLTIENVGGQFPEKLPKIPKNVAQDTYQAMLDKVKRNNMIDSLVNEMNSTLDKSRKLQLIKQINQLRSGRVQPK